MLAYYVMIGLCAGGRVAVGVNYMTEFLPENKQTFAITALNCGDASTMIFQAIYYHFNRNWMPVHLFQIGLAAFLILMITPVPESPKFFYANGKFTEARRALKKVAKFNGNVMSSIQVDAIVFDLEIKEKVQYVDLNGQDFACNEKTKINDVSEDVSVVDENVEVIKLQGKNSEICSIWQLRVNSILLAVIMSSCSFCYFLINF